MRSVRDSFDSDGEFLPDAESRDAVAKSQRNKVPPRANVVPEGVAVGFKRASELLRDTEAVKHGFDASLSGKDDLKPVKTSTARRKTKDNAKPKARTRTSHVKKNSSLSLAAEIPESPVQQTSCYFANDGTENVQSVTIASTRRGQEVKTHDLLDKERRIQDKKSTVSLTENHRSDLSTIFKPNEIGLESGSIFMAVKGNEQHSIAKDDRSSMIDALPTVKQNSIPPIIATVDLTVDHDNSDTNENGTIEMASVVKKHSPRAHDSIIANSHKSIDLTREEAAKQVIAADVSLARPILTKAMSPIKKKSPAKKKQLTMTERALDEFRPEETRDSLPLQEYFTIVSPKKQTEAIKQTSRAKPRTKTGGTTRKVEKKSLLLAPTDALQSLHDQNLVFGTSSQLLQNSSSPNQPQNNTSWEHPMANSKLSRDDSFIDIDLLLDNPSNILGLKSTRSLWSAAARDDSGTLMVAENSTISDASRESITIQDPSLITITDTVLEPKLQDQNLNIQEAHEPASPLLGDILDESPAILKAIPILPRSLGEAATKQREMSRSPVKKRRKTRDLVVTPQDAFKKVPVADIKAELQTFGCKPPRSKAKMVELLLECRANQNQNKQQETGTETIQSQPLPSLGIQTTALHTVSDTNPDPLAETASITNLSQAKRKRPRVKDLITDPSSNDEPPPSFQVPPAEDEQDELDEAQLNELMSGIHQAIITQPPTHSITNPSWKEKMAMYDPIVLEELTAWLNTGGLDAIGVDTEVSPTLVRDWCESKSVCFIWATEGWRKNRS